MFRTPWIHDQEDRLYTQFCMVCFSCIYVSNLAGGRMCSSTSFHLLDCWHYMVVKYFIVFLFNNCNILGNCQHFRNVFCLAYGDNRLHRNAANYFWFYMFSQPKAAISRANAVNSKMLYFKLLRFNCKGLCRRPNIVLYGWFLIPFISSCWDYICNNKLYLTSSSEHAASLLFARRRRHSHWSEKLNHLNSRYWRMLRKNL